MSRSSGEEWPRSTDPPYLPLPPEAVVVDLCSGEAGMTRVRCSKRGTYCWKRDAIAGLDPAADLLRKGGAEHIADRIVTVAGDGDGGGVRFPLLICAMHRSLCRTAGNAHSDATREHAMGDATLNGLRAVADAIASRLFHRKSGAPHFAVLSDGEEAAVEWLAVEAAWSAKDGTSPNCTWMWKTDLANAAGCLGMTAATLLIAARGGGVGSPPHHLLDCDSLVDRAARGQLLPDELRTGLIAAESHRVTGAGAVAEHAADLAGITEPRNGLWLLSGWAGWFAAAATVAPSQSTAVISGDRPPLIVADVEGGYGTPVRCSALLDALEKMLVLHTPQPRPLYLPPLIHPTTGVKIDADGDRIDVSEIDVTSCCAALLLRTVLRRLFAPDAVIVCVRRADAAVGHWMRSEGYINAVQQADVMINQLHAAGEHGTARHAAGLLLQASHGDVGAHRPAEHPMTCLGEGGRYDWDAWAAHRGKTTMKARDEFTMLAAQLRERAQGRGMADPSPRTLGAAKALDAA